MLVREVTPCTELKLRLIYSSLLAKVNFNKVTEKTKPENTRKNKHKHGINRKVKLTISQEDVLILSTNHWPVGACEKMLVFTIVYSRVGLALTHLPIYPVQISKKGSNVNSHFVLSSFCLQYPFCL